MKTIDAVRWTTKSTAALVIGRTLRNDRRAQHNNRSLIGGDGEVPILFVTWVFFVTWNEATASLLRLGKAITRLQKLPRGRAAR